MKRILVIDDDPCTTRMVRVSLERVGGHEVREENDAREAVQAARDFQPDLVVLDVCMPGADGGDVAAELGRDRLCRSIPILFLTSLVEKGEHPGDVVCRGGFWFVAKPVSPRRLLALIDLVLAGHDVDEAQTMEPSR